MTKWLVIGGVVVIILAAIAFFFLRPHTSPANPGTTGGTTLPSSGQVTVTGPTRTVQTSDKKTLSVHDFSQDTDVQTDPNIPGQYFLAGGVFADQTTPYQVFYQSDDDYFGITLYHEPLKATRAAAEIELMNRLGISKDDMCRLNYVVAPGPGVNDAYAGENLGFSFCPGATKLP